MRQKAADGVIPTEVRVVALRATVGGQPVTIITGTSTDLLSQVNSEFVRHLLLGLPVILILAAGIVWLVVGRALRPVEKIRHAVTDITSADLSQRVPEPGTADEIGNLARTMNDMLGRLEAAASKQRRFVADASHELRSPLAAIRTTLEVGLAHPDRAPWPVIAERAAQQSARLEDLIQQLLLLAKADEHLLAANQQPVDSPVLREIRAIVAAHHMTSSIDVERRRALVIGNPDHLQRLLRNVIDNAVRYADSRVLITASPPTRTRSASSRRRRSRHPRRRTRACLRPLRTPGQQPRTRHRHHRPRPGHRPGDRPRPPRNDRHRPQPQRRRPRPDQASGR